MLRLVALLSLVLNACSAAPAGVERLGTHLLVELFDAPFDMLNSSSAVLRALRSAVEIGGLTVVGELVHSFPVMGVSALLLISESHLSVHTWTERGYAAVDLFTCGEPSPLPCAPSEAVRFLGHGRGWSCMDGSPAAEGGSLWKATESLLRGLDARGASVTWVLLDQAL